MKRFFAWLGDIFGGGNFGASLRARIALSAALAALAGAGAVGLLLQYGGWSGNRWAAVAIAGVLVAGVAALASIVFADFLVRRINDPLARLRHTVEQLSAGNFEARTRMRGRDAFGRLGTALDALLDERVSTMARSAQENEELNNSVIAIMQAVGTIATTKDLGLKVPVTENVTGAISDALNLLTEETGRVLRNVAAVSRDVAHATVAVRGQSELASQAAERERTEVGLAARELALAAEALTAVARVAGEANEVASHTVATSSAAMESVVRTLGAIVASRELIRETEKRIKRLGERSQEIGQVVNIIQSIAQRTGILALNASMQAAAAGDAGHSFAVVADEVKRLSESSQEATGQIGRMIQAIQTETSETVLAMNEAIARVVEISRVADEAGEGMRLTRAATEELAANVRDIANTSVEQARVSSRLQERARVIREASDETARQLVAQTSETHRLVEYARALLREVSVFKVPKRPE
jgi:methyl-accepting chemotaxis protein